MKLKLRYPITIRSLSEEEGGGYLAEYPDLPGCQADGETVEEALSEAEDALTSWIETAKKYNDPIPSPGANSHSGQWRIRAPKMLHEKLAYQAKHEGVSLNTLAISLLAEGIGFRIAKRIGRTKKSRLSLKKNKQSTKLPSRELNKERAKN